ncbi:hypothetical protein [Microvirga lenta]|uniref:hypothetical protein n=1 Tax=Microvirga lenta TaxID=2881337 RepID=UPI001CFF83BC|nr:hypothetical protein [Microvirga lenta]MCB5176352.1 hypothetical protein [Microvirga lenta]
MTFATRSAIALGLGLTLIGTAMAAPAARHDGTWSVRMVTDSGTCDSNYDYSIAIEEGSVRYLQGPGDAPASVSGRVGSDGNVNLDIRRSIAKVDAQGRLNGKSGSGTWNLAMLGCSGRWNAQKRSGNA